MDVPYRNELRLWEKPSWTVMHEAPAVPARSVAGPHNPRDFAARLFASETLNPFPVVAHGDSVEPYSLQWFLSIEDQRHGRQGRWIPRLLEFAKHSGETLLGLGNGLGTDWLQYARHGASVVVCSPSTNHLALIQRNFELRGLGGRFLQSSPENLPLESASIDVACLSNLLHEVDDPEPVVQEVYRVLKPGGKVLAVTSARYDVDYWFHACFPWYRWLHPHRRPPMPVSGRFTARGLYRLFGRFSDHRVHKRQLRRAEVPHIWRWLPLPVLERFGGRVLVLKAFKPLSDAITLAARAA